MQDITPVLKSGAKVIESYGNGSFVVSGERLSGNIIITPNSVHPLSATQIETITAADIEPILGSSEKVEILLIGGGAATEFLSEALLVKLRSNGIVAEHMSTGAAARTYNILLTEERKVAVVLIAV